MLLKMNILATHKICLGSDFTKNSADKLKIETRIELLREKLNKCIDNNSFSIVNEEILNISEELDMIIIEYIKGR